MSPPKTRANHRKIFDSQLSDTYTSVEEWVGRSQSIAALLNEAMGAAEWSDHPILISGPVGSGKSHLARLIHERSRRRHRPIEIIDCGALPELQNLLFGHRRGAFTGAHAHLEGRLMHADGGTVVLDDFERLSRHHQDQFHRVVVDGVFHALGSSTAQEVDLRFIATTNADLEAAVRNGTVKRDFLSRLDYFHLRVPSLHDRPEDVPDLCTMLLRRHLSRRAVSGPDCGGRSVRFDPSCWPVIQSRRFPDNVRGLDKLIVRLLVRIEDREVIRPSDVEAVAPTLARSRTPWFDQPKTLRTVREAAEREYIIEVCRHTKFNLRAAARSLEISPKCLYEKLKRYGITRP